MAAGTQHDCALVGEQHSWVPKHGIPACRQLEILHNSDTGAEHGSLLWLLDHSMTVFGGRLLRSWVAHPLRDAAAIQERLDAVEELAEARSESPPRTSAQCCCMDVLVWNC